MFFFYTKMPYYVFKHYSGVIYLYMFLTVSPVCMFYDANNEKKKTKNVAHVFVQYIVYTCIRITQKLLMKMYYI